MTTRWEKGDEYIRLIVEGQGVNVNTLKSALEINLDGNILIDLTAMTGLNEDSISYLNEFANRHKTKRFSILIASKNPIEGITFEVVPTITEARDMIFMEITERELGFFGDEELE
jgi:hypothetical protein